MVGGDGNFPNTPFPSFTEELLGGEVDWCGGCDSEFIILGFQYAETFTPLTFDATSNVMAIERDPMKDIGS